MKKILLVITTFFFAFSLSGCIFDGPDNKQDATEEFCRENPENEICQGEGVGDLEYDTILNVFNTILREYNNESNDSFCDDYFSITNISLLESCRLDRGQFFPEGMTEFKDIQITKELSLSTEDTFTVITLSENNIYEVTFSITLTKIEGVMYINNWKYEMKNINPVQLEVPFEEAQQHFDQFVNDYLNNAIDSTVLCESYPVWENIADCIKDRNENLSNNLVVTVDEFTKQDDIFVAKLTFTDDIETKSEVQRISFSYNSDGTILMKFIDNNEYELEQIKSFYNMFLNEFMTTSNIDETCSNYYIHSNQQNCQNNYQDMIKNNYTIELVDIQKDLEYYIVQLKLKHSYYEEYVNSYLTFEPQGDTYLIGNYFPHVEDNIKQLITNLINDYNNSDLSHETVCSTYFTEDSMNGCIVDRTESFTAHRFVSTFDIYFDYYGRLNLVLTYSNNLENIEKIFIIEVYDTNKISFIESKGNELTYEEVKLYIDNLVQAFNSTNITDIDFGTKYIDATTREDITKFRTNEVSKGNTIQSYNLIYSDSYTLELTMSDNQLYKFNIIIVPGDSILVKMIQIPNTVLDIETMFTSFITDYFDSSKSIDELLNNYASNDSLDGLHNRNMILEETYSVNSITVSEVTPFGFYIGTFLLNDGTNTEAHTILFTTTFDNSGVMKLQLEFDQLYPSYDEIFSYALQFRTDLENQTLTTEDFCGMYFEHSQKNSCLSNRDDYLLQDYTLSYLEIYRDEYSARFVGRFKDSDDTVITQKVFEVYQLFDIFGNKELRINNQSNDPVDYYNVKSYLDNMVMTWQDGTLSVDHFCTQDAVCHNSLDGKIIKDASYSDLYHTEDFYNNYFQVNITYIYDDDTKEVHYYKIFIIKTDYSTSYLMEYIGQE